MKWTGGRKETAYIQSDSITSTPDPQFINHIYYYHVDSLIELEQIEARMKTKTKALGFGGSDAGFIMDGEKSPIRLKTGDHTQFAVKIGMSMADPSMMIKLYKFDSKKGNREAILSSQGGMYNGGKTEEKMKSVSIFKKPGMMSTSLYLHQH